MIKLPWPPSVNGYWRTFRNRQILSAKAREYRDKVVGHLAVKQMLGPLSTRIWLQPPDKRRRDVDNFSKPVLDALTHAGAWEDDSQIMHLDVVMCEPVKGGGVTVQVDELTVDDLQRLREAGL